MSKTINALTENTTPGNGDFIPEWKIADGTTKKVSLLNSRYYSNPYKFSVYRNAAWTSGSPGVVNFDTKTFDTGSNVDIVTNKGRFTAPAAGFYFFTSYISVAMGNTQFIIAYIYKNGSKVANGTQWISNTVQTNVAITSAFLQLAANDYVEVYCYGSGNAGVTGADATAFQGFLISFT